MDIESVIPVLIIVIYFALTVFIGLLAMRKSKSSDSFHGTAMSTFAIVAASAGEWLGGTSTTGVSEYGFNYGVSGAWYTIANGIGVLFLALFFAKLYRSLNSVTVPGIIEKFFGVNARTVSSVLLTIVMLAVGLSQMVAAGSLGKSLLGFPVTPTIIVFAVIFIIYTLAGGMNAVAETNKMHLFAMYTGVIIAVVFAIVKLGGFDALYDGLGNVSGVTQQAIDTAAANSPSFHPSPQHPASSYFGMFTIGFRDVSSWVIASLLGACTAQAGIQPVLAAKNVQTARKASFITAAVCAPFGLFTAFLGMSAKAMFNNGTLIYDKSGDLIGGKTALPTLMLNIHSNPVIGSIVGGLVLASILAAILSTVSPIILSAGTMITKDLYQRVLRPDASDKQVLRVSRITTALSGVVCAAAAVALFNLSSVLKIVYAAYSLRGALFIVALFGIYWKKASEKGACWSMVLTGIVAIFWKVFELLNGYYPINANISETYAAVFVAFFATIIFSFVFPKKQVALKR